jgi:hypothetical protein
MQASPEILQKYTLKPDETTASAQSSAEPPVVQSRETSLAGQAVLKFSEDIIFVQEVLNLNSSNEGPLFFKIKLIVHARNLDMLPVEDRQSRRLLSSKHAFKWSLL